MNPEDVLNPEKNAFMKSLQQIAEKRKGEIERGATKIAKNITEEGKVLPKDALNISDQTLEKMYAQAYQLYNLGKYADAQKMFGTLVMLNVTEPKYLFGLAASEHMMKDYETAASHYVKCSMVDVESPIPFYHASDCFIHAKDMGSAMITLHLTVKRCGDKTEFSTMKERAAMTLENLKLQQKEGTGKTKGESLEENTPELEK